VDRKPGYNLAEEAACLTRRVEIGEAKTGIPVICDGWRISVLAREYHALMTERAFTDYLRRIRMNVFEQNGL
jgi:hypothetical protein